MAEAEVIRIQDGKRADPQLCRGRTALLVSNHSGTLPLDALMMKLAVYEGTGRHCRLLAADLPFRLPFVGEIARKSGNTLACAEDSTRLLDADEIVGVFPEGYKG